MAKYEYVWQVVLETDEVIEHIEEYAEVGDSGELSLFYQNTFLGFSTVVARGVEVLIETVLGRHDDEDSLLRGDRFGGTTYAAGEWVSFSPFIIDNTDDIIDNTDDIMEENGYFLKQPE